jgi:hypothetical protein
MEFKIVEVKSGIAIFNYVELKKDLEAKLNTYKNYLVTKDKLTKAKNDRSLLTKVKKAIEQERTHAKKEILKLYNETFEPQCNELVALVDGVNASIDNQIKGFESSKKKAKRVEIEEYYDTTYVSTLVKIDKIFNDRWLNVGYSLENIKKDIAKKETTIKDNIEMIKTTFKDDFETVVSEYLFCLDLPLAIKNHQAKVDLKNKINPTAPICTPTEEQVQRQNQQQEEATSNELYQVKIVITSTRDKIFAVAQFMKDNNIAYVQVKEDTE